MELKGFDEPNVQHQFSESVERHFRDLERGQTQAVQATRDVHFANEQRGTVRWINNDFIRGATRPKFSEILPKSL